jgi:hypothetical protein
LAPASIPRVGSSKISTSQFLASHFASLGPGQPIRLGRGGQAEIELVAIVATGFAKPLPWAYGLHP